MLEGGKFDCDAFLMYENAFWEELGWPKALVTSAFEDGKFDWETFLTFLSTVAEDGIDSFLLSEDAISNIF